MKIILSQDGDNKIPETADWLRYMGIDHSYIEFWNPETKQFALPKYVEDTIIVWNHDLLENLLSCIDAFESLLDFASRNNQLWVMGFDTAAALSDIANYRVKMQQLDTMLPRHALILFLDAQPTVDFYTHYMQNIGINVMPWNYCFRPQPRPQASTLDKSKATKDYLLTMILKNNRYHREVLWQHLQSDPQLMDRGLISVRTKKEQPWVGMTAGAENLAMHASMDLYLDCYLEIVPEGHYNDLHMFTEKTHKPIMTKTPFLVVSTAGYLDYLRNSGFRTFHSLVDESYDNHDRIQDRVASLVQVLWYIIDNGSSEFYQASQEILDHNFNRLCEISGSWQHEFDQMMWRSLEQFGKRSLS